MALVNWDRITATAGRVRVSLSCQDTGLPGAAEEEAPGEENWDRDCNKNPNVKFGGHLVYPLFEAGISSPLLFRM